MTVETSSYLQYLPTPFRESPFLGRFLLPFEQMLTGLPGTPPGEEQGLERKLDEIAVHFDPAGTPEDFVPWLAGWAALALRADWTLDQQRKFIGMAIPLYKRRGTKENLVDLLRLHTVYPPTVIDTAGTAFQIGVTSTIGVNTQLGGGQPHYFQVRVNFPPDLATIERETKIIRALIDTEKPAHTYYDLIPTFNTMQIGVHSTIGVDTLLGSIPV